MNDEEREAFNRIRAYIMCNIDAIVEVGDKPSEDDCWITQSEMVTRLMLMMMLNTKEEAEKVGLSALRKAYKLGVIEFGKTDDGENKFKYKYINIPK